MRIIPALISNVGPCHRYRLIDSLIYVLCLLCVCVWYVCIIIGSVCVVHMSRCWCVSYWLNQYLRFRFNWATNRLDCDCLHWCEPFSVSPSLFSRKTFCLFSVIATIIIIIIIILLCVYVCVSFFFCNHFYCICCYYYCSKVIPQPTLPLPSDRSIDLFLGHNGYKSETHTSTHT